MASTPPEPDKWARRLAFAERWVKVLFTITAVVGSAWVGVNTFWQSVGNVATDSELAGEVQKHDKDKEAHAPLRDVFRALNAQDMHLESELRECRKANEEIGARVTRLIAADAEPNPKIRKLAADYYERVYRRLVSRGVKAGDAVLEALDTPWPGRPRI